MPLTKTQADGINLADTFAFTGTVSQGSPSINVLSGLNKVWWHIDSNNGQIDDSFNVGSIVDGGSYTAVTFSNPMDSNKWTCVLTSQLKDVIMSIFGSFETTTECYYRFWYPHLGSNASPDDVSGILTGDLA